jgi:hypothetical protein
MSAGEGEILLTVFLKHQKDKNLGEINAKLEATEFWKKFPPEGIEVVNWYVMMGIGQVAILKVPGHRLREINLAIEQSAWGAFDTEFYPTYDFMPVLKSLQEKHRGASGGTGDD